MKPAVKRTFVTRAGVEQVYAYLLDFANAEQWDPGTQSCERVSGDGGVGSVYRNVSKFMGREVRLTYTTVEAEPPTRVHLVGTNDSFEGHDILGFRAVAGGTEVTYFAEFHLQGASQLGAPLVALYLPRLADKTTKQMQRRLDGLADGGGTTGAGR